MPEHFHLLMTEPEVGDPSVVLKVVKQRLARRVKRKGKRGSAGQRSLWDAAPRSVWQKRFYDWRSKIARSTGLGMGRAQSPTHSQTTRMSGAPGWSNPSPIKSKSDP